MLSLKIPDLNLPKNTSELVCSYFRFMHWNKYNQNTKKKKRENKLCLSVNVLSSKTPIKNNIFMFWRQDCHYVVI